MTVGKLTRRERDLRARTEADPLAWAVREIVRECGGSAQASPAVWLHELHGRAGDRARSAPGWPTTPEQLGRRFGELAPGLALLSMVLTRHRSGLCGRRWRAETVAHREARRHLEGAERERCEVEAAREREEKAHLRAAISLARELRRREKRKKR